MNKTKMKILLVESHYRSRSWFAAIKEIDDLFILSVLPEEKKLFLNGGISKERILDLHNPNLENIDFNDAADYLKTIEKKMTFSYSEIVSMDRTMRLKDYQYIVKYLYYITTYTIDFINQHKISIVFLEPTWSHEIILCKICEFMSIPTLAPVTDKVLANHFFLFHGYLRNTPFLRNQHTTLQDGAEKAIAFVNGGEKHKYFQRFSKRNRLNFHKFKVLFELTRLTIFGFMNKNIQPKLHHSILRKTASIFRVHFFTYFNKFYKVLDVDLPYILVTLHVQPEAGIDVVGSRYSNQLQFVRQIARTTPVDHFVLVKEHPHDFGRRGSYFYNELYKLPNVKVLGPYEDSSDAIKKSSLVISTAGTSSLEASLFGIPAVTAVEMYFKDLMVVESFDPNIQEVASLLLKAKAWKESITQEKNIKILRKIQENMFVGNSGDCMIDPSVLSKENIDNIRKAFFEAIERYRE